MIFTVPSGSIAGQSGFILLKNTGGHALGVGSSFKFDSGLVTTISAAGTYLLSYFAESNSAVYLVTSKALV
jgi:hypothetical protein